MRVPNVKRPAFFLVLALAASLLLTVSCGGNEEEAGGAAATPGGDTTGVSDTEVKVGTLIPITGAMAPWGVPISSGMRAYFDWINKQGGIYGRKITFLVGDSAYSGPQATEAARKLVEQDKVFLLFGNLGTEVESAVAKYLEERNVPDMYILTGSSLFTSPVAKNRFSTMMNYTTEAKIFATYIKENYDGKKIGILAQNDDYGKEGGAATEQALKDFGADVTFTTEWYDATVTDLTPQVQRLKTDDVDLIMFWGGVPQAANMMKTARQTLSWDVPIILNEACAAEITATLAGYENIEGAVSLTVGTQAWETDKPVIQKIKSEMASVAPDLAFDNYSLVGWTMAEALTGLLKQAGPDLTREGFIAAAESICNYMTETGLIPASTSPTDHKMLEAEIFVRATTDYSVDPPVFHWVKFGDPIGFETTTDCTVPTPPADATKQPGPKLGIESYATPRPQ